jgi:hypothetical protein
MRRYKFRKNHKKCQKKDPMELEQFLECVGKTCAGDASVDVEVKKKVRIEDS